MQPPTIPQPKNWRLNTMIARSIGIVAIALGFVLGLHGLDHPETHWLQTALGLLVTSMMAQGYALYCSIKVMRSRNS